MATPMRETGKVHNWLPFHSEDEARHALLTYAIHANMPDAALIWTDATGAKLLQQGTADKDGDVKVLIAHAHGPIPPPTVPPSTNEILQSFDSVAANMLADAEKAGRAVASGLKTVASDIGSAWKRGNDYIDEHEEGFDVATVTFDGIAVIGGLFGIFFGGAVIMSLGGVALIAGGLLLGADGYHLALEVADDQLHEAWAQTDKNGKIIPKYKALEQDSLVYQTIEWIAPFLCLPDLVAHAPEELNKGIKAFKELGKLATKEASAEDKLGAATNRLTNYTANRGADSSKIKQSTVSRYQRQINAAKRTLALQKDKLKAARVESISGAFAGAGSPMTGYGFGVMISSPPKIPSYVKSGWHDLGSWFTPNGDSAPLMPDAGQSVYHGGFHGGYSTYRGADPWTDMENYLSIHLAITRIKPK